MKRQLFIYYRIPKAEFALGVSCAQLLAEQLLKQGLGHLALFQREELDKPYFTLMEVITPEASHSANIERFSTKVQALANVCFKAMSNPPARHLELFSEVNAKDVC